MDDVKLEQPPSEESREELTAGKEEPNDSVESEQG